MKIPPYVSPEATDLIKGVSHIVPHKELDLGLTLTKLLVVDANKRLRLEQVQQHPWILKYRVKGHRTGDQNMT